ncbi:hypothetical protein J2N86_13735 [Legionella lytica]|uniref:Uncharacterized protein n=1 Tax=Legionella lytica TaxID=96232 RepID=A0ABY4Y8E9_9GAMM|nr:hypothetical protein [Legionella lytica]USQ13716.1 hypothetical protein J2N86_13735 [Legionella lytica]
MKNFILAVFILLQPWPSFANKGDCSTTIDGYKVVKNSVYPFLIDKDKACFFAFYVDKAQLNYAEENHDDNFEDEAMWYGYYKLSSPHHIIEFPKPSDLLWLGICRINAISFYDMNGDGVRDVSVIGSCNHLSSLKYTYPLVFIRYKDKYIFNEDVYSRLYGFIDLTIADIHAYIKDPKNNYQLLRNRYNKLEIKSQKI